MKDDKDRRAPELNLDAFVDLVFTLCGEGRIDRVSSSCRSLLGREPEELRGLPFSELLAVEERAQFDRELRDLAKGSEALPMDLTLPRRGKTDLPARLSMCAVFEERELLGYQGVLREDWNGAKLKQVMNEREYRIGALEDMIDGMNSVAGMEAQFSIILEPFLQVDRYCFGAIYLLEDEKTFALSTQLKAEEQVEQGLLPEKIDETYLPEDYFDSPRLLYHMRENKPCRLLEMLHESGYLRSVVVPVASFGSLKAVVLLAGEGEPGEDEPVSHVILRHAGGLLGLFARNAELQEEATLFASRFRDLTEGSADHIWEVDREGRYTYNSPNIKQVVGYEPEEVLGKRPTDFIHLDDREDAIALLKLIQQEKKPLRGMVFRVVTPEGKEVYIESRAFPIFDEQGEVSGYRGVDRDIGDWFEAQHILEETLTGTCESLSRMVELRDPYTKGHSARVANLMVLIGTRLGRSPYEVQGLRLMGLLHDIGKVGIPTEILSKPGKLTPQEFELIRMHPQMSHDILKDIPFPWPVAEVVLQHHERMDGSGYPQGLDGDEIMWQVRLMAVADLLEAMSTDRPYRSGLGLDIAVRELELGRGTLFDSEIVDAVLRIHASGDLATFLVEEKNTQTDFTDLAAQREKAGLEKSNRLGDRPVAEPGESLLAGLKPVL